MSKGVTIQQFGGLALAFIVGAVIIGITGTILTQTQKTQCQGGSAYWNATNHTCNQANTTVASNATWQGLQGIVTLSNWLPTIAVVVAAAVVIGIIVNYFK